MAKHGGKRTGAGRKPGLASILAERSRAYIAERIETDLAPIVEKAIEQAKAGDKYARDWLSDQAWGKARQNVGLDGGEDGQPIQVIVPAAVSAAFNIDATSDGQTE